MITRQSQKSNHQISQSIQTRRSTRLLRKNRFSSSKSNINGSKTFDLNKKCMKRCQYKQNDDLNDIITDRKEKQTKNKKIKKNRNKNKIQRKRPINSQTNKRTNRKRSIRNINIERQLQSDSQNELIISQNNHNHTMPTRRSNSISHRLRQRNNQQSIVLIEYTNRRSNRRSRFIRMNHGDTISISSIQEIRDRRGTLDRMDQNAQPIQIQNSNILIPLQIHNELPIVRFQRRQAYNPFSDELFETFSNKNSNFEWFLSRNKLFFVQKLTKQHLQKCDKCMVCLADFMENNEQENNQNNMVEKQKDRIVQQNQQKDNEVIQLFCSHLYHRKCITKWLKQNPNCPACRKDFRKHEQYMQWDKDYIKRIQQQKPESSFFNQLFSANYFDWDIYFNTIDLQEQQLRNPPLTINIEQTLFHGINLTNLSRDFDNAYHEVLQIPSRQPRTVIQQYSLNWNQQ